ncbi:MAG: type IV pilus twitching motility protein PilT [Methylacidiphilales bacterium]|nr:type IV pilus twitching motility protein PilT [Candidatus Methylacidiphilales bacterium]
MELSIVQLLAATVERGGSDLHLCAGSQPMVRIQGLMVPLLDTVLDTDACRALVYSCFTEIQRERFEQTLELDFALTVANLGRFRSNAHLNRGAVEAAFRHIPDEVPSLDKLGLPPIIKRLCSAERGLILVTGITGSGKTTTLAAMIQEINSTRSGIIITIEDPIEYLFSHKLCRIKQREIGSDTRSFPNALHHVMRQDPDVILVSDLTDYQTISAALTAAETGRLVLAPLHTVDAPRTIDRLVDAFPADQQGQSVAQLANSLLAIVTQRLLPRADGIGRIPCVEVMLMNEGVRACIRDRRFQPILSMIELGGKEGMITFDESVSSLFAQGLISRDTALGNARDPNRIQAIKPAAPAKKGLFGKG